MPTVKVQYPWRYYRTRSIETSCQYDYIMTGTRTSRLSCFLRQPGLTLRVSDALMEECVRMMQQSLRSAPTIKKRAKSVLTQRNLGTIKERKKEKRQETEATSEQTIMRILRMRPRTQEFIAQQLQILAAVQADQEQRAREAEERKAKRQLHHLQQTPAVPSVPPLPGQ